MHMLSFFAGVMTGLAVVLVLALWCANLYAKT